MRLLPMKCPACKNSSRFDQQDRLIVGIQEVRTQLIAEDPPRPRSAVGGAHCMACTIPHPRPVDRRPTLIALVHRRPDRFADRWTPDACPVVRADQRRLRGSTSAFWDWW